MEDKVLKVNYGPNLHRSKELNFFEKVKFHCIKKNSVHFNTIVLVPIIEQNEILSMQCSKARRKSYILSSHQGQP
jgi:hypothetical protein